ncbi:hypothetical protein NQ314_005447 [Rhamnusium bicolor]|uniref:Regulatory protein zeste n=1 Tax=Rhamnusium bicolor TaxID=1586634 RepID=A0AAV8ZGU8_9CUCU|nr:hypothetical protein NQ314_005447 [Rhamnusium bicolor]
MPQKITGTRGNRSNRMTKSQKDFMVNFLEKNKFLLETNINQFELEKYNNSWKLLANELNKLPGANKSIPQWKQALNEFKANTRRKARLIQIQHTGTGGGPKTEIDLTDLEERLLALLSKIVILGAPSIPEVGILDKPEEPIEETISKNVILKMIMKWYNLPDVTKHVSIVGTSSESDGLGEEEIPKKGRQFG